MPWRQEEAGLLLLSLSLSLFPSLSLSPSHSLSLGTEAAGLLGEARALLPSLGAEAAGSL